MTFKRNYACWGNFLEYIVRSKLQVKTMEELMERLFVKLANFSRLDALQ